MKDTLSALFDDLIQLQAILDVTAVALDEGTPRHNKKICWSGIFDVAGKLAQQALNNVEILQDSLEDNQASGGNHESL